MTAGDCAVHRFRPTSGAVTGWLGVAAATGVAVLTLVSERNGWGLRVALGAAIAGLLTWMVLLRPRVTAYADTLLLRNAVSDVHLPMAGVDTVVVRHALLVWVGDHRYVCAGIGRSSRSMLRQRLADRRAATAAPEPGGTYADFVETRITELARAARREHGSAGDVPVRRTWARTELVALAVLAAALGVSLLL